MSGHSKWHNIQKTKGAQDAKRSAAFTKIAKEIIVAVKEGGGSGDPANNSRLATVIAKAKAVNMPNENIKRTIDKALGAGSTENFEAVTYEGYGPGGVAVIVEALTDNRQRVDIHYNCIGAFDVPPRRKIRSANMIMETSKGVLRPYKAIWAMQLLPSP